MENFEFLCIIDVLEKENEGFFEKTRELLCDVGWKRSGGDGLGLVVGDAI